MDNPPIACAFTRNGWHHQQVTRQGEVAIYRRWKLYDGQPGAEHYEVVRLSWQEAGYAPSGAYVPAHERYPGSSAWGTRGWTFKTLPEAQAKMQSLIRLAQEEMHDA